MLWRKREIWKWVDKVWLRMSR